jgi:hypothetical protein
MLIMKNQKLNQVLIYLQTFIVKMYKSFFQTQKISEDYFWLNSFLKQGNIYFRKTKINNNCY